MTNRSAEGAPESSRSKKDPGRAGLLWSRILVIVGFVLMLVGVIDPLEGAIVIVPGSGMVALGAFLSRSRHRKLLLWAFILLAVGACALVGLSALGGLGEGTGRSMWWALALLPYPAGWITGVVGAILRLIESFKGQASATHQTRSQDGREPGADAEEPRRK